jgi:hypothetical protein
MLIDIDAFKNTEHNNSIENEYIQERLSSTISPSINHHFAFSKLIRWQRVKLYFASMFRTWPLPYCTNGPEFVRY